MRPNATFDSVLFGSEADYQGRDAVELFPNQVGARASATMSFNPITGLVYFPATIDGGSIFAVNQDFTYQPGKHNEGVARGVTVGNLVFQVAPDGRFLAYNAETGKN